MNETPDAILSSSLSHIDKFLTVIESSITALKPLVDRVERKYHHVPSLDSDHRKKIEGSVESQIQKTEQLSNELRHMSNRLRGLGYASLDYRHRADIINANVKATMPDNPQ